MARKRNRRSIKEKLAERKQQTFIGREEQLALFRTNFNENTPDNELYNIFNIHGQGGVGKTTLSRQYERIVNENNALVAFIDLESNIKNIPTLIAEIVKQLKIEGAKFPNFDKKYKTFRQEKEQLEKDPEAPKGIVNTIGSTLTRIGIEEVKKFPGTSMMDLVPTNAIASHIGDIASFIRKKITNKDELQLLLEPIEVLTPIFLNEVYDNTEHQDCCLIFDTYETVFPKLDNWLRAIYNSKYGKVPENLLTVISGREELSDKWNDFQTITHKIPLERFTEREAEMFLKNRNITNNAVVKTIIDISDKLPVLMDY